jgi:hypothetical protein
MPTFRTITNEKWHNNFMQNSVTNFDFDDTKEQSQLQQMKDIHSDSNSTCCVFVKGDIVFKSAQISIVIFSALIHHKTYNHAQSNNRIFVNSHNHWDHINLFCIYYINIIFHEMPSSRYANVMGGKSLKCARFECETRIFWSKLQCDLPGRN